MPVGNTAKSMSDFEIVVVTESCWE